MAYSSRSLVTMIRVPVAPRASSWAAHLVREHAEVAGVEAHRAEPGSGHLDRRGGRPPRRRRCRRAAWCPVPSALHLGPERLLLGVVQQREAVRAGAGGGHAVPLAGGEVRAGGEAGDVRRPRAGHRRLLVGTARAHLDAGPVARGQRHPRRGRGDRRVVVVDRQQQRLQQHRLGERRLHDQQRRVGEVGLALGVAPHVAGEPVAGQPVERRRGRRRPRARRGPRRRTGTARSRRGPGRRRPTTPYLRPSGSRRGKSSKTERRWAVPDWSAASSMVSS